MEPRRHQPPSSHEVLWGDHPKEGLCFYFCRLGRRTSCRLLSRPMTRPRQDSLLPGKVPLRGVVTAAGHLELTDSLFQLSLRMGGIFGLFLGTPSLTLVSEEPLWRSPARNPTLCCESLKHPVQGTSSWHLSYVPSSAPYTTLLHPPSGPPFFCFCSSYLASHNIQRLSPTGACTHSPLCLHRASSV